MGWSFTNLTTATSGAPLAVYQPTAWLFAQSTRHVVFQGYTPTAGGDGQLYELYCSGGDDWNVKNLVAEADGFPVGTNAKGYIWAHEGSQHVVYQGLRLDGRVHELWYTEDDGWNHNDLTSAGNAPLTLSQPFGYETFYDGAQRVVYHARAIGGGGIHELRNTGDGWHDADLTTSIGAPLCAGDAAPTGYAFEDQKTAHVLYRTEQGHIVELWEDGSGWHWGDLTAITGAPVSSDAETVTGYVFRGQGTQHIDYVGGDGHLHELWWAADGWHHNDLTIAAGAAAPFPTSSPAGYAFEAGLFQPVATQHVIFTGHDEMVHELWWREDAWHTNDIGALVGAPPIVGGPVAFVEVDVGTQNVFYLSDAHQLIELRWTV